MKHMLRLCVLAAAMLMALPGPAKAADAGGTALNPYIGLGLGVYNLKFSQTGFSQNSYQFGGFVNMGVSLYDFLGAELRVGMTEEQKNQYPGGNVYLHADYMFSYLGKLQLPLTQEFSIYGLAGGTTAKFRLKVVPTSFLSANASKSTTSVSFGGGFDYKVDDFMSVGLEYMRYLNGSKVNNAGFPTSKITADSYTATLKIMM